MPSNAGRVLRTLGFRRTAGGPHSQPQPVLRTDRMMQSFSQEGSR